MPLYEFVCNVCESRQEHWASVGGRNTLKPTCACGAAMQRLPGGTGLLWFEEGRGRVLAAFGKKPITSHAEHTRLMRQHGVVEAGNTLPPGIAKREPKTEAMKRFREKDPRGKWV